MKSESNSKLNSNNCFHHRQSIKFYPRINWGRGRLLPYESMHSFVAKFAHLNGISARECRNFFVKIASEPNWIEAGFGDVGIRRVARLLDEPISIIKTLDPHAFRLFVRRNYSNVDFSSIWSIRTLSCCPVCIAKGYNASFHLYSWLKKCPIHGTDYEHITLESNVNATNFDGCVDALTNRLDRATAGGWISLKTREALSEEFSCKRFKTFCRWMRSVKRYQRAFESATVISLSEIGDSSLELPEFLARINWAVPMPKMVEELVSFSPERIKPTVLNYPVELVSRFSSLFSPKSHRYSYSLFASFYISTQAAIGGNSKFRESVLSRIESMKVEFAGLGWRWLYANNHWVSVAPCEETYWGFQTPLECAIEDLHSVWTHTDFLAESTRRRSKARMGYLLLAHELIKYGLLAAANSEGWNSKGKTIYRPLEYMTSFTINLDSDVISLIEDMLFYEAMADVDAAVEWLRRVARGAKPVPGPERRQPGHLLIEARQAKLQIWERTE